MMALFAASSPALGQVVITTGSNLGTFPLGIFDIFLSATGGTGAYTWTLVSGKLPANTAIRADLPPGTPAGASAAISGFANTANTYTFTLQAASGASTPATRTFTVKIANLMLMERDNTAATPGAFVGTPFSYTFSPLNNTGVVTFGTCGGASMNLPPGLTLSAGGVLSGTPTQSGVYVLDFSITDNNDSLCFSPTVSVHDLQIISPAMLPNGTQYEPYSYPLSASGGTPPYTFTNGGMPSGLAMSSGGMISGTITNAAGPYGMTVTVTDSQRVSYTKWMTLPINGEPPILPAINPYGNFDDCSFGTYCSRPLALNFGTAPYTWAITGLPNGMSARVGSGVTIDSVYPGDVELWGVPLQSGPFTVHAVVTDVNGLTGTQNMTLRVSALGVDNGGVGVLHSTYNVPYSYTYRISGGMGPYSVQLIGGELPHNITASGTAQGIFFGGTPIENGPLFPEFLVTDSAGNRFQLTTPNINANGAPGTTIYLNSIWDLVGPRVVGTDPNLQFTANGAPSYTWTLLSGTLPPGTTLSSSGLLSRTLTTAGSFSFVVEAQDQSNPANFGVRYVTFVATPVSITTAGTLPSGNVGTPYSQTLATTGTSGAATWALGAPNGSWITNNNGNLYLPPGLTLSSAGVLSGTPTTTGDYSFPVTITDAAGNRSWIQFSIQVFAAGQNPPLALNFGPTVGPSLIGTITRQLTASGGVPPYHFSYSPGAPVAPGMRVLDGPPLPTSFPPTTTGGWAGVILNPGSYTTSLRVTDSIGATFDRPVWWTVVNTTLLDQGSLPKATVGAAYSYTFHPYGGSGNFSWTATNLPPGLSISSNGMISGTPAIAGSYSSTVTMTDLTNNTSINYTEAIAVNAFAITTGGVLPQGMISQAYSQQLSAPNCGSGCTWTVASGSLPSEITLSSSGLLSGRPSAFYNSGFLVQAAGSNGTVQKQFSLLINYNTIQPLYISTGAAAGAIFGPNNLNTVIANSLSAQGGAPPYTWSVLSGVLPPGISLTGPGETLGANLLPASPTWPAG